MTTLDFRGRMPGPGGGADPNFRLSAGDVLSRTFTVWTANLTSFTALAGLVMTPGLAVLAVGSTLRDPRAQLLIALGGAMLQGMLRLVLTGAVTYGVFEDLRGQRVGLHELLSAGFSRVGTVLLVGLLSGIIVFFGSVALCVPGLILMTMYWLAVPVAVVESPGTTESLSRSAELTSGNRWSVFGVAMTMGVLRSAVSFGVGMVLSVIGTVARGHAEATASGLSQLAAGVVMLPFDCLVAVAPVVAYHDLVVGKEGSDIGDLIKVFE
jgi:hypothetical protein